MTVIVGMSSSRELPFGIQAILGHVHPSSSSFVGKRDQVEDRSDLREVWKPTTTAESKKEPRRVGHPYQSRAPAKHKKPRTSFTKQQVSYLETRFVQQKYLASTERASLACELEMSDAQVKTWFQNRRTKWRFVLELVSLISISLQAAGGRRQGVRR